NRPMPTIDELMTGPPWRQRPALSTKRGRSTPRPRKSAPGRDEEGPLRLSLTLSSAPEQVGSGVSRDLGTRGGGCHQRLDPSSVEPYLFDYRLHKVSPGKPAGELCSQVAWNRRWVPARRPSKLLIRGANLRRGVREPAGNRAGWPRAASLP